MLSVRSAFVVWGSLVLPGDGAIEISSVGICVARQCHRKVNVANFFARTSPDRQQDDDEGHEPRQRQDQHECQERRLARRRVHCAPHGARNVC